MSESPSTTPLALVVTPPAESPTNVTTPAAAAGTPSASASEVLSPTSAAEAADATPLSPATRGKLSQAEIVHDVVRERKRSMILVDGWVDVQERTFTRWTNYQLGKRQMHIADLKTGLADGTALCALVEVLSKRTLPSKAKAAKSQIQRLDNLRIAFDFMEKVEKGIHLVNVRPGDVEGGNLKIILGLVWGLIHKYMIVDLAKAAAESKKAANQAASASSLETTGHAEEPVSSPASSSSESSAKLELLKWVNEQVAPYHLGSATDFGRSWQDGKLLSALVDSLEESMRKAKAQEGAEEAPAAAPTAGRVLHLADDALTDTGDAIEKAEKSYGIPALMDAGDIVHRPQEHSLMTYIACFRECIVQAKEDAEEARRRTAEADARRTEQARLQAIEADDAQATEKAEAEARQQAEKEAREQAEREAREKAEAEAREQAERDAREKAEKDASERAEREAREQAEKDASERAEREAREQAEAEAAEAAAQAKADEDVALVINPTPSTLTMTVDAPAPSSSSTPDLGDSSAGRGDDVGVTVPLSPLHVEKEEDVGLGAVLEDDTDHLTAAAAAAVSSAENSDRSATSTPTAPADADADAPAGSGAARPSHERLSSTTMTPEELASLSERNRKDSQPELVGAYIDSESLELAVSTPKSAAGAFRVVSPSPKVQPIAEEEGEGAAPASTPAVAASSPAAQPTGTPKDGEPFDSEKQSQLDAAVAPMDIERKTAEITLPSHKGSSASSPADPEGPRPDVNAMDDYTGAEEEDAEGRMRGETIQQSIDRRIECLMNDIEICIVTPDQKYLQSDANGVVRANELNTASATWTIIDGAGGWRYLRDYQSRYLACDPDGRVYTCKKKKECRFRVIRGATQFFEDSHGRFLAVHANGTTVGTDDKRSMNAAFKICFPVVEGILQKKGTSGLHRWQERYFAFNGSVMSYWRKQKAVGKERPSGIYHPNRMMSVNINRQVAKRFNIVFADGKVVELLAPTVEEAIRWVRGLNSRGIRTVQQTKRMSVFPQQGAGLPTQGVNLVSTTLASPPPAATAAASAAPAAQPHPASSPPATAAAASSSS